MVLVCLPVQIISNPVAKGSRVPACPIFSFIGWPSSFLSFKLLAAIFILFTTSCDVQRSGLLMASVYPAKNCCNENGVVADKRFFL